MADPLSVAGTIVGIAAAGMHISLKLYALAEKVATASQRVASIANDISSTCAILNQLRDLIEPRLNNDGQYYSAFNATALTEISTTIRHCELIFKNVDTLQKQAFKNVLVYSPAAAKVELSKSEKMKWPFLQPEFEEVRNDLQHSKINLALMVAVAHLAFVQNGNGQRRVDKDERAVPKSTVFELQRARLAGAKHDVSAAPAVDPPVADMDKDRGIKNIFRKFGAGNQRKEVAMEQQQPREAIDKGPAGVQSPIANQPAPPNPHHPPNDLNNSQTAKIDSEIKPRTISAQDNTQNADEFIVPPSDPPTVKRPTEAPLINPSEPSILHAWTTSVLPGLSTGLEQSIDIHLLDMPQDKIQEMLHQHNAKNQRPMEVLYKLNAYQRRLVLEHINARKSTLLYIGTWHTETIPSVFGELKVVILIWITQMPAPNLWIRKDKQYTPAELRLRQRLNGVWGKEEKESKEVADPNVPPRKPRPTWAKARVSEDETLNDGSKIMLGFRSAPVASPANTMKDMLATGGVEEPESKSVEDVVVDELLTKWTEYNGTQDADTR